MESKEKIQIFDLLKVLDNLKHLKRTGWLHYNVPEPETVASHMYRMAVLAMALDSPVSSPWSSGEKLDVQRCVKMALVHDIGEALVGDITPRCGVADDEKFRLEEEAIKTIGSYVPAFVRDEWRALWLEYEGASTAEARVVKQLDKLDMIAQALHYEQRYAINLSEFFASAPIERFTTAPINEWAQDVHAAHAAWLATTTTRSDSNPPNNAANGASDARKTTNSESFL